MPPTVVDARRVVRNGDVTTTEVVHEDDVAGVETEREEVAGKTHVLLADPQQQTVRSGRAHAQLKVGLVTFQPAEANQMLIKLKYNHLNLFSYRVNLLRICGSV